MEYVKERILGKGSFGTVYLIRGHLANQEPVLHVLKEISIRDDRHYHHARQESQLLSQLNHPNIIQYLDSFQSTDSNLCLIMEYCSGGDVNARIRQRRGVPFEERLILNWFRQLSSVLHYIHDRKILHRDVKTGKTVRSIGFTRIHRIISYQSKSTYSLTLGWSK